MPIGAPRDLRQCQRLFLEPRSPKHRQYEALRAFFVEGRASADAARAFGYTPASFQVLCHHFRRDPEPVFFVSPRSGPRRRQGQQTVRARIVALRKQNYSVYEISDKLKQRGTELSPTGVREVLTG